MQMSANSILVIGGGGAGLIAAWRAASMGAPILLLERNHKAGIKAASVVTRYGIRLLPELYAHLNPMPFGAAVQMEQDLAEDLRRAGYTVAGGH